MTTTRAILEMFERGILLNQELLAKEATAFLKTEIKEDILVLNEDYLRLITERKQTIDWLTLDTYRATAEKDQDYSAYQKQLLEMTLPAEIAAEEHLPELNNEEKTTFTAPSFLPATSSSPSPPLSYLFVDAPGLQNQSIKYELKHFTNIFLTRYRFLEGILRNREGLSNLLSISRLLGKKEKETISIIGMVQEVGTTKNGNLMVILEDLTGVIKLLISKNKKDIFLQAKDLIPDEVIGVHGVYGDKIIFVEKIIWPDLPNRELKKNPDGPEEYAIFLSDIHVGSTLFLKEEFNKFLQWINGNYGEQSQRDIARHVKYVFIVGDLIDGVGIYPTQETELELKTIEEQYAELTRLLQQVPSDKQLIICPGNHDVVHLAEPQPSLYKEYISTLHQLPNVTLVTNPAMITIAKSETFSGYDVLMYHGYSFDYYVANVESIRSNGGYQRADLIMKFLLKRRHLAPSFKSTPYFPKYPEDPLLIKKIPDFFVTGHIHYCSIDNYKSVTTISCSCWQGKTSFQEKLGHKPEPARVPVVNLKTRDTTILYFE